MENFRSDVVRADSNSAVFKGTRYVPPHLRLPDRITPYEQQSQQFWTRTPGNYSGTPPAASRGPGMYSSRNSSSRSFSCNQRNRSIPLKPPEKFTGQAPPSYRSRFTFDRR